MPCSGIRDTYISGTDHFAKSDGVAAGSKIQGPVWIAMWWPRAAKVPSFLPSILSSFLPSFLPSFHPSGARGGGLRRAYACGSGYRAVGVHGGKGVLVRGGKWWWVL